MINSLKKLSVFMRPFLGQIILAITLTGGLTLIGMAPPLLMGRLINDVAKDGNWAVFPLIMTLLFGVPVLRAITKSPKPLGSFIQATSSDEQPLRDAMARPD